MNGITLRAPAKLNLSLDITGVRPDGYHTMDMLMQAVSLYERVTVRRSGILRVTANGALLPLGAYVVAVAPGHTHVALQDPMLLAAQTRNSEVRKACKTLYISLRRVVDRLMLGPPITF